ncbi:hypothetical protein [Spirosoma linguale]|uniref:Uncharacterized protein n=1 Tax=Spirosoma linguale (strain ATCC 33905 / DSM 74 / LMG 10896 / Claus 1) TaxID=504472 RepID=D2QRW5_SPILD|nr:hypothetical protein Slin_5582 [Spirosoma linguale DSM 74]
MFALALLLLVGIGYVLYWILKRLGYPRIGKVLLFSSGILFALLILFIAFEEQFFSKGDAEKLLLEQNIELTDNFELLKNESMSAIGDYYHTFTLEISEKDKHKIIHSITSASDFRIKKSETWIDDSLFQVPNRYIGRKTIQNYATKPFFIRELFEPQGNGYAPKFRKIKVNKKGNTLVFEDIDE